MLTPNSFPLAGAFRAPTSTTIGQLLAKFDQNWTNFGRIGPYLSIRWPVLVDFGAQSPKITPKMRALFVQCSCISPGSVLCPIRRAACFQVQSRAPSAALWRAFVAACLRDARCAAPQHFSFRRHNPWPRAAVKGSGVLCRLREMDGRVPAMGREVPGSRCALARSRLRGCHGPVPCRPASPHVSLMFGFCCHEIFLQTETFPESSDDAIADLR